jgi:hypothetical protein
MGWFSRKTQGATDPAEQREASESAGELDVSDPDFSGRPLAKPLSQQEQQRIDHALEQLAQRGVDVDDLASIGAAYDSSCGAGGAVGLGGAHDTCELIGIAIGEHLHRHSTLKWAIVTDTFGTDLGLAAARSETVVVPHNLVSARWMRRETGWIPRVVGHLLSINARR